MKELVLIQRYCDDRLKHIKTVIYVFFYPAHLIVCLATLKGK